MIMRLSLQDGKQEGFTLEIGSNTLPEQLEKALIGKKKGDTVDMEVPYPDDFQNKTVAGKSVRFQIEVLEIKKKVLPNIDDEFAKDAGKTDLNAFKNELKTTLLDRKLAQQKEDQRKVLSEKLVAMHSFEVPDSMVSYELRTMMSYFKGSPNEAENPEKMEKLLAPMAKQRVQEGLVLSEISKQEKFEISTEEVETEIEAIAQRRGFSPAEMKRQIHKKDGAISGLRSQLLERKALDFVFSKAGFEDVIEAEVTSEKDSDSETSTKTTNKPEEGGES